MNLAELLDKVPTAELRNALERRRKVRTLPEDKLAKYAVALSYILREHRISRETLLSNAKHTHAVEARWALYGRLYQQGFTPSEISTATRHDGTRVFHGLRSLKLIAQPA